MHNEHGWDDYFYFLKVATSGNLKAAARELGVNYSSVFRRINSLEAKLKVRLFERLKSGYTLTEAGEDILERVQHVDEQMNTIQRLIQGKDVHLSGHLKISTTDTIGSMMTRPMSLMVLACAFRLGKSSAKSNGRYWLFASITPCTR